MSGTGASVVIPFGGAARLPLLEATLARLNGAPGVDQIVIAEYGRMPLALAAAKMAGADHIFLAGDPPFDKVRAINAGTALARRADIIWCDGDLLICPNFIIRAIEEFRSGKFDFFFPFSRINYLGESDTADVLDGRRQAEDCEVQRILSPLDGGAPGGMGIVRREFLGRNGGMMEGFRGWGHEDVAWVRKVEMLGNLGKTSQNNQQLWHLFHSDGGSHSNAAGDAAALANPGYAKNAALSRHVFAMTDAEQLRREFPRPEHSTPPWPAETDILFLIAAPANSATARRAEKWAATIEKIYGTVPTLVRGSKKRLEDAVRRQPAALMAGFADSARGRGRLTKVLGDRSFVIVPAPPDQGQIIPPRARMIVLPISERQRASWEKHGARTWHRCWQKGDPATAAPTIVQPLSQLLAPRRWNIRIKLNRSVMPDSAFDSPRFWYIGFHDSTGKEMLRADLNGMEFVHIMGPGNDPVVIARDIESPRPPASWTVWPTDRNGHWLDRISGPVDADCLDIS